MILEIGREKKNSGERLLLLEDGYLTWENGYKRGRVGGPDTCFPVKELSKHYYRCIHKEPREYDEV